MLQDLRLRYPFRRYQRMILDSIEAGQFTSPYHLVAPPGSGKTIVGLELIRRLGHPAVVFAPTAATQARWCEQVGLFLDDPAAVRRCVSADPTRLAPITVLTYQLVTGTGDALDRVAEAARARWVEELLTGGRVASEAAGRARIYALQKNDRRAYERELSRRCQRVKRELLHGGVDVAPFLHPNARTLIDALVRHGVRTVVLDECHHLLDYWALVVRCLLDRVAAAGDEPVIIGLSASLPSPEDGSAYENYTSLLGDVDCEVPTPAVVKEGDLAPYRDLACFVEPSERERDFLDGIQGAFEQALTELLGRTAFKTWVAETVLGDGAAHETLPRGNAPLALAGARFLRWAGQPVPPTAPVPREAKEPLGLADWATLLERFALDELRPSADPGDQALLDRLQAVLRDIGLTLTERGLRRSRSTGDLVLALSESKDFAVVRILGRESGALGPRLRAVVVTDFERTASGVQRLGDVLARDAGSALRVFRRLVTDERTADLRPVLVTGRTVRGGAAWADELVTFFAAALRRRGWRAACHARRTGIPEIVEIGGEGPDWSPGRQVAIVTDAFDEGLVRCLVSTHRILGEDWDALALNTLVDLTSVTTATSVQQLRGRAIRLDPSWPRKVAHHWDVVCVAPAYARGDSDLRRFVARHQRHWGIMPVGHRRAPLGEAGAAVGLGAGPADDPTSGEDLRGRVVRGVGHVDPELAFELAAKPFRQVGFQEATKRMLAEIGRRDRSYDLWGVGDEYRNVTSSATRLSGDDLKVRTVHTVQETLRGILRAFRAPLAASLLLVVAAAVRAAGDALPAGQPVARVAVPVLALALLVTLPANAAGAWRLGRALLVDQPPDAVLMDVGRAVLAALRDAGAVSAQLQDDLVRVVERPDNSYEVLLDRASPGDAATFVTAYRQVFEPVTDQRYLVARDDERLPSVALRALWLPLRRLLRRAEGHPPAWHPVPAVLASRREGAEVFARHWARYVGGGRLVDTGGDDGWQALLAARAQRRLKVDGLTFEVWS